MFCGNVIKCYRHMAEKMIRMEMIGNGIGILNRMIRGDLTKHLNS